MRPITTTVDSDSRAGTVRLSNWLGNMTVNADRVVRPATTTQVQEAVASETGKIVVLGRRMSKTGLVSAEGGCALDMSRFVGVVSVEGNRVVVRAGTSLYDLTKVLYGYGRQIPGFTITANVSVGGCVTAPTKGNNHPFIPGANSVSGALLSLKLVRPTDELAELIAGRDDEEIALVKDSYGSIGIVVDVTLRTVPLVTADVTEIALPLDRVLDDEAEHERVLNSRFLLCPKLKVAVLRLHENQREGAEPSEAYEELVGSPDNPYVRLMHKVPMWARRSVMAGMVEMGSTPFLNQTRYLKPDDLRRIYGRTYDRWRDALRERDPDGKFGSPYMRKFLGRESAETRQTRTGVG